MNNERKIRLPGQLTSFSFPLIISRLPFAESERSVEAEWGGKVSYKWLVAIAFGAGLFMDLMDATIVNVALPTLGRDFGASTDTLELVVTGYLISLALWIPASGWISDRFGSKRTFAFALGVFTIGSALCGLAWGVCLLIAIRVLQGVGGGMVTPVRTAVLFRAFPPAERGRASAVGPVPTAIAP